MLERATACLKSRAAREPLRCASPASRSRRLLHSAFWTHGAGDLDLHLATLPALSPPRAGSRDDSSNENNSRRRRKCTEEQGCSGGTADGIFLDFLYPPQALAWYVRANIQQGQRWERRSARGVLEGSFTSARGYASRPQTDRNAVEENEKVEKGEIDSEKSRLVSNENEADGLLSSPKDDMIDDAGPPKPSLAYDPFHLDLELDREQPFDPTGKLQPAEAGSGTCNVDPTAGNTAVFSAGTVADAALDSHDPAESYRSADNMQTLRNILMSSRDRVERVGIHQSSAVTAHAWGLFTSLEESAQNETRLRIEMLSWLASQGDAIADSHGQGLFTKIPMASRNLPVYKAALSIFLRNNLVDYAADAHREALQNIENGYEVSKTLFKHAMDHDLWELAVEIQAEHSATYSGTARSNQVSIFWFYVSEMPGLFHKALALGEHLSAKLRTHETTIQFENFCVTLFREAITQEFLSSSNTKKTADDQDSVPSKQIRKLFQLVALLDKDAAGIFDATLTALLSPNSRFTYAKYERIIPFIYREYRRFPGVIPSEGLLLALLKALTRHASTLQRANSKNNNLSIITVANELKRYHHKLTVEAVGILLVQYARQGHTEQFDTWYNYMCAEYPSYDDQKNFLWTTIYVQARRADLDGAQQAFAEVKRITSEHGDSPDLRCWNLLIYAHSRADDLAGGLTNLQNLINYAKLTPDVFSFHPVSEMLARKGDVGGVKDILRQYDQLTSEKRQTTLYGSLIMAHARAKDIAGAEAVLKDLIPLANRGVVRGTLTHCCNILLMAHALQRDNEGLMRIYRVMKSEKIPIDANSYAQLMYGLTLLGYNDKAFKILRRVLPGYKVKPTAFHYAICMNGYNMVGQYKKAIEVYEHMERSNIASTLSTRAAFLRAKATLEQKEGRPSKPGGRRNPLEDTIKDLLAGLEHDPGDLGLGSKDPQLLVGWNSSAEAAPAAYFDNLLQVHGQRRCFEAVRELHERYLVSSGRDKTGEPPPVRILTSLMLANTLAGQYEQVEDCWNLAKQLADELTSPVRVPDLTGRGTTHLSEMDALELTPGSRQQSVNEPRDIAHDAEISPVVSPPVESKHNETDSRGLLPEVVSSKAQPPVEARKYMLSRTVHRYVIALHRQRRTTDMITTFISILRQGYAVDARTWNTFIQRLCQHSPPLALLAFVLTERFLIDDFPGWTWTGVFHTPRITRQRAGSQHMRQRQPRPGQLMPQYHTLVQLGGAILDLRKREVAGRTEPDRSLEKYVGTVREIRRRAPKTLYAVQTMPRVADKAQAKILRRDNEG